jgi:hypothetical protein
VQFRSLRSLLKTKLIRLGEFDRLIDQRRRERVEGRKRNRAVAAPRSSRTTDAIGPAPRAAGGGVQVGRYMASSDAPPQWSAPSHYAQHLPPILSGVRRTGPFYAPSWSSSALASLRSAVSKPSVNQL